MIAEIVRLSGYESQVSALLGEEEQMAMEYFIACAPEDHPVIPGTGGFRKARWARSGGGKSGGLRVIYSEGESLPADQHVLERLASHIKKAQRKIDEE